MGIKDKGYAMFAPGDGLIELVVVDKYAGHRETVFSPRANDVLKICKEYGFDFDYTMGLIDGKNPDVHTMVIEVHKYREHLREIGMTDG